MKKILSFTISCLLVIFCLMPVSATEAKHSVDIEFGHMYFDESKDLNQVRFDVKLNGKYVDIDRIIIHFSVDKNIIEDNNIFAGDVTLDYTTRWEKTDDGYDLIITSYQKSDFTDFKYSTGFKMLKTGVHNLSASAEIVYKNGTTEKPDVKLLKLRNEVIDISVVEFVYVNKENLDMHPYVVTAYVNCGTTVGDFLEVADTKNAVVMLRDGTILNSDDIIPADAFIATMFETDVIDTVGIDFYGDIDGDGKVTAIDARMVLRHSAQIDRLMQVSEYAADIDGKTGISASDARLILRKAAQLD